MQYILTEEELENIKYSQKDDVEKLHARYDRVVKFLVYMLTNKEFPPCAIDRENNPDGHYDCSECRINDIDPAGRYGIAQPIICGQHRYYSK